MKKRIFPGKAGGSVQGVLQAASHKPIMLTDEAASLLPANRAAAVSVRRSLVGRWFFLGLGLVGAMGTALVYWLGGYMVLRGAFTIGTIVAFTAYLAQLYGPMASLTNAPVEFAQSLVSFERVFEILDLPV